MSPGISEFFPRCRGTFGARFAHLAEVGRMFGQDKSNLRTSQRPGKNGLSEGRMEILARMNRL
jgi:hypothetical protein